MARHRTFIAVELTKAMRERLQGLQERFSTAESQVKWVGPENLHLTMLFLGEVDERDLIDVCRIVETTCGEREPFPMSLAGVGGFPCFQKPRIVWAGVMEGKEELIALHHAMEEPLLELGCYRREDRAFTPHITLGRTREEGGQALLAKALEKAKSWQGGTMIVEEIQVMSSQLMPQGPVYSVMSRAKLKGELK